MGLDPKLSHVSLVPGSTLRGIVVTGLRPRLSKGEAASRLAQALEQSYWDSSYLRKILPYFTQFSVLLTVGSPLECLA